MRAVPGWILCALFQREKHLSYAFLGHYAVGKGVEYHSVDGSHRRVAVAARAAPTNAGRAFVVAVSASLARCNGHPRPAHPAANQTRQQCRGGHHTRRHAVWIPRFPTLLDPPECVLVQDRIDLRGNPLAPGFSLPGSRTASVEVVRPGIEIVPEHRFDLGAAPRFPPEGDPLAVEQLHDPLVPERIAQVTV